MEIFFSALFSNNYSYPQKKHSPLSSVQRSKGNCDGSLYLWLKEAYLAGSTVGSAGASTSAAFFRSLFMRFLSCARV